MKLVIENGLTHFAQICYDNYIIICIPETQDFVLKTSSNKLN